MPDTAATKAADDKVTKPHELQIRTDIAHESLHDLNEFVQVGS